MVDELNIEFKIAMRLSNARGALEQLEGGGYPPEPFLSVILKDLTLCAETLRLLYFAHVDELMEVEGGYLFRDARDKSWFTDTIHEAASNGYNAQMFFNAAYCIARAVANQEDVPEKERSLLGEVCELIEDCIEEYWNESMGNQDFDSEDDAGAVK